MGRPKSVLNSPRPVSKSSLSKVPDTRCRGPSVPSAARAGGWLMTAASTMPKRAIENVGGVVRLIIASPSFTFYLQGGTARLIALDDQSEGPKWAFDQTADDERQQYKERQHEGSEQRNSQRPE